MHVLIPKFNMSSLHVFTEKNDVTLLNRFFNHTYTTIWLVILRINVDLAIFQQYLDFEAGDNQSLKFQVARPGIEPRSSCSASQELNHSATAAPHTKRSRAYNKVSLFGDGGRGDVVKAKKAGRDRCRIFFFFFFFFFFLTNRILEIGYRKYENLLFIFELYTVLYILFFTIYLSKGEKDSK